MGVGCEHVSTRFEFDFADGLFKDDGVEVYLFAVMLGEEFPGCAFLFHWMYAGKEHTLRVIRNISLMSLKCTCRLLWRVSRWSILS